MTFPSHGKCTNHSQKIIDLSSSNAWTWDLDFVCRCGHSVNKLLHSVAPRFPRLQNCRLKRCTHLDDAAIQTASTSWHELKALELCEGRRLTDASLYALASGCPMLEKLDFSDCSNITETGLVALVKNCHNLRHLNLWGCYDAGTDSALQVLTQLIRITNSKLSSSRIDTPFRFFSRRWESIAKRSSHSTLDGVDKSPTKAY